MASLLNRWNQQLILCLYICHFILEPRNDNSMRKKRKKKIKLWSPLSEQSLGDDTRCDPLRLRPQIVDLEKDTRRWWFSPRL